MRPGWSRPILWNSPCEREARPPQCRVRAGPSVRPTSWRPGEQLGAGPRPRWVTGPPTTSNLLADSARMSRESSGGPTSAETVREIIQTVGELTRRCEREQRRKLQLVALARRALTGSHDAEHTGKVEVCRPAPRIAQSRAPTRRDIPWPLDGHWMAVDS